MTQQLTNHASLWVERLGRFGYISKGVVYGIVGLLYQAFSGKFRKELNLTELSNTEVQWVMRICRFGLAARGIVFWALHKCGMNQLRTGISLYLK
ncbi:hypothetical protein [Nostoc favosum]|uniref:Transposase n=1 Tax=Nostoc favosum CHAB5714 TaxID=2780399 RepID=A0ABS8ILW8_9NOSO|nr:hypothetical protein [Nostoc favosum]MCC5604477.1 hypothetical protein [Nostoc favosum CHAB5714]